MGLPIRYLQVNIELPNNDHETQMFEQYMRQLLPTFTEKPWPGWDLFLSAKRQPDRDPSSETDEPDRKSYLHIWRVRDYNSLPYIMECFDDNPTYVSLDLMVQKETQDFTEALVYNPQTENPDFDPSEGAHYYMHVTMDVIQDAEILTEFRSFMTECAEDPNSPMRKEFGWELVNGTYAQTGRLRRYFHVWRTSSSMPNAEGAIAWLKDQATIKKVLNPDVTPNPQWQVWEPVDYLAGS